MVRQRLSNPRPEVFVSRNFGFLGFCGLHPQRGQLGAVVRLGKSADDFDFGTRRHGSFHRRSDDDDELLDFHRRNTRLLGQIFGHSLNIEFRQRLVRQHAARIDHDRGESILGNQARAKIGDRVVAAGSSASASLRT